MKVPIVKATTAQNRVAIVNRRITSSSYWTLARTGAARSATATIALPCPLGAPPGCGPARIPAPHAIGVAGRRRFDLDQAQRLGLELGYGFSGRSGAEHGGSDLGRRAGAARAQGRARPAVGLARGRLARPDAGAGGEPHLRRPVRGDRLGGDLRALVGRHDLPDPAAHRGLPDHGPDPRGRALRGQPAPRAGRAGERSATRSPRSAPIRPRSPSWASRCCSCSSPGSASR